MAKYAVNEEGIQALQSVASAIVDAASQILNSTNLIEDSCEENLETLGPHKAALQSAIEQIKKAEKDATKPVKEMSATLKNIAESYQEIIDNDLLSGGEGNGNNTIGSSTTGTTGDGSGADKNVNSKLSKGNQFVPLLVTNQGFEHVKLNGRDVTIFDHPFDFQDKNHVCNQGSAFPNGPQGTCGNCASGSIMNKAGHNYSERDVVGFAMDKGYCSPSGGTSPDSWVKILDGMAGIKSSASNSDSLETLAEKVEEGKGVIIGVNAKVYRADWYGPYDPNNAAGHALVLDSVIRDEKTGEIIEYVVIDSNGKSQENACHRVGKRILESAFSILGKQSVVTDEIIW